MSELIGGKKVAFLVANEGVEQIELTRPWDEIGDAGAETVVFVPCGYSLDHAADEGRSLLERPELRAARIVAVDANSQFSRPGPRLVDGLEVLAWVQHPDRFPNRQPNLVKELRRAARQGTTGG
jgi:iron complex transport system substrate-binding protein